MARPVGLSSVVVAAVRTVTGAPVAADSSSLVDATFAPTPDDVVGGAVNALFLKSIWLNVELVGGTTPKVTVEILVRDDGAADGSRWKPLGSPPIVYQLDGTGFVEVQVYGRLVFPRLSAVSGSPTSVTLVAFPGERLPGRTFI